jgi:DNA-binding NtrC family response regulator
VQDGSYRRVGENRERRADVRIVVAANQRLEDLVLVERFRADMLYRLRGIGLTVPPLRERGRDILRLARHFVREASSGTKTLSPRADADLQTYAWPGNVRELEQEMRRAVALADSGVIEWRKPTAPAPPTPSATDQEEAEAGSPTSLRQALMSAERRSVRAALSRYATRAEAARMLGISRQALHHKILRYGL